MSANAMVCLILLFSLACGSENEIFAVIGNAVQTVTSTGETNISHRHLASKGSTSVGLIIVFFVCIFICFSFFISLLARFCSGNGSGARPDNIPQVVIHGTISSTNAGANQVVERNVTFARELQHRAEAAAAAIAAAAAATPTPHREHHSIMIQSDDLDQIDWQLDLDDDESASTELQNKQRNFYQEFLEPCTMIIVQDDFIESQCSEGCKSPAEAEAARRNIASTQSRGRHLNLPQLITETSSLGGGDSVSQLPGIRTVPASCAICLADYEAGETIVWAREQQCSHVFHQECILNWLSTGKKRCPVCRNWFAKTLIKH